MGSSADAPADARRAAEMIADARRAAEMTLLTVVDTVAIDMILLTVDSRGAARQRRRMRHAEAGAVSRAKRILSGEYDTVFLWRDLARGVVQRDEEMQMQVLLLWPRTGRTLRQAFVEYRTFRIST